MPPPGSVIVCPTSSSEPYQPERVGPSSYWNTRVTPLPKRRVSTRPVTVTDAAVRYGCFPETAGPGNPPYPRSCVCTPETSYVLTTTSPLGYAREPTRPDASKAPRDRKSDDNAACPCTLFHALTTRPSASNSRTSRAICVAMGRWFRSSPSRESACVYAHAGRLEPA